VYQRLFQFIVVTAFCAVAAPSVAAASDSRSFAVRVEGSGPPMILIPGFVSSGAVWDEVVEKYRTRYQCHVLTLPGFAGQPALEAPVLPRVRDEIVAYIRGRQLERPVLVGHSAGGFLALWVAATAPDLVGPVVSVDGVPFFSALRDPAATAESARPQAEQMRKLYATMTQEQLALQSRMAFAAMMSDPARVDPATKWAALSNPQAAGEMIAELMTIDLREAVSAIRSPVLLIGAVKAFASTPGGLERARAAYGGQVARIANHEVALATGALHFVMYDDLAFLLETMNGFLARAAAKGRR
jgi:pimeloyl-ACP methyl ester carboxylesterase